jgi:hypothetical protein
MITNLRPSGLHSKFKDNPEYKMRYCFKKKKKDSINNLKRKVTYRMSEVFANQVSDKYDYPEIQRTSQTQKKNHTHTHTHTHTHLKNEQRTWMAISPKKTYKWPISTWKDAKYY